MTRFDPATVAGTAFACGALLIVLTGCAELEDYVSKQHRESYPTFESAQHDWVGVDIPAWIPDDASDLRNLATFDETVSVIRVVTESPLAGDCVSADRHSAPRLSAEWVIDEWPATVERCGDYEVMETPDGWLGWFNATEPGQTPG